MVFDLIERADERRYVCFDIREYFMTQRAAPENEIDTVLPEEGRVVRRCVYRERGEVERRRDVREGILIAADVEWSALEDKEVGVNVAGVCDLQPKQIALRTSFDVRVGDLLL